MKIKSTKKKSKKTDDIKENEEEIKTEEINEPIVLQLNLSNDKIESIIGKSNDKNDIFADPVPYDRENNLSMMNDVEIIEDIKDNNSIKKHHEIVCYWCCHKIFQTEFGMPIRYDVFHNSFTMYGSFCSLECVAAYNYSVHMGCDRVWEINSWIQYLGKMYGYTNPIRPAPSRYLLNIFNGPLTIDEFRNSHKEQRRSLVINIPPFIHVSSQMEILNTSFLENNKKSLSAGGVKKKQNINIANTTISTIEQKLNLEL
jgi:hypothetical protein